jgi:hypothetical protein
MHQLDLFGCVLCVLVRFVFHGGPDRLEIVGRDDVSRAQLKELV